MFFYSVNKNQICVSYNFPFDFFSVFVCEAPEDLFDFPAESTLLMMK